ncbi:MAG: Gfo/Idh/MocA family oxidoreductase [bacterium]|nr:Gfo/Idh/MocA family oxidoreductase [bacterium]
MMSQPVRLGVVGAGYWGANLVRNCAQLGVLSVVSDLNAATLAAVHGAHPGVAVTLEVEDLLSAPIDGVVIAAPAPLHASLARRAASAGKHVFVEKPFALTVAEAQSIVEETERCGVTSMAGHVLLYHPAVERLLELVRAGAVGRVAHVRSRRLSLGKLREHESVWWSFAPHDVALVLEILGETPLEISGRQHRFSAHALPDMAYADACFADGRSAHVEVSWRDPGKTSRLDVFGSEGVLTFTDSRAGASLTLTRCGERREEHGGRGIWREEPQTVAFTAGEPLRRELEAFIETIRTGVPALTDGRKAVEVVRVLATFDACSGIPQEALV